MSSDAIVRFSSSSAEEQYYLPAEKLIAGNPKQSLWKRYTDRSGKFFAGIWASEIGKWHVNYTEEEYCRILEGESVITDIEGKAMTVKVGDEFVIPAGFVGTWEVVLPTRKTYVIYEA
ncbi:MAG TPA: cupin domain-containing protein [Burkholderiaceae bacterium]